MRKPDLRLLPFILFVGLAALCALPLLKGIDPAQHASVLVGHPRPATPAGLPVTAGPVLVNFFASWCVPCAAEQADLAALAARGLPVDGVAYKDTPAAVRSFLKAHGNPYRKLAHDDGAAALDWGVTGVPETFLIDAQGVVRARWQGAVVPDKVIAALDQIKAGE